MLQPDILTRRSSVEAFARASIREGQRIVQIEGTWWKEVRPCFYRTVIPFLPVGESRPRRPLLAACGAVQYAPYGDEPANSCLRHLAFEPAADYRLEQLKANRRWEVRSAAKLFELRAFRDAAEFGDRAHPVYVEFQARTGYGYLPERVQKDKFAAWAQAVFSDPGIIPLGLWQGDTLAAVSLSRIVEPLWIYSSFFARAEALRQHAASLMLHEVRQLAAQATGVRQVFVGMRKTGEAGEKVDSFYFLRGAVEVRTPTVLRINPLLAWSLARLKPSLLQQLRGTDDVETVSAGGSAEPKA